MPSRHLAIIGRLIPGQVVTNGRHVARVTDRYGLEYLDGTGYGAKLDDSWRPVIFEEVGSIGSIVSLDDVAAHANIHHVALEPRHRFGETYSLGNQRVICVRPGKLDAWAAAEVSQPMTWREVVVGLPASFGIVRRGSALSASRLCAETPPENPSFGCAVDLGKGDYAIYAFPAQEQAWITRRGGVAMTWEQVTGVEPLARDEDRAPRLTYSQITPSSVALDDPELQAVVRCEIDPVIEQEIALFHEALPRNVIEIERAGAGYRMTLQAGDHEVVRIFETDRDTIEAIRVCRDLLSLSMGE